jgi:hypothetical protein
LRSANPEACDLHNRRPNGAEAYKERVLKFALEYPALLAATKAREAASHKLPGK